MYIFVRKNVYSDTHEFYLDVSQPFVFKDYKPIGDDFKEFTIKCFGKFKTNISCIGPECLYVTEKQKEHIEYEFKKWKNSEEFDRKMESILNED